MTGAYRLDCTILLHSVKAITMFRNLPYRLRAPTTAECWRSLSAVAAPVGVRLGAFEPPVQRNPLAEGHLLFADPPDLAAEHYELAVGDPPPLVWRPLSSSVARRPASWGPSRTDRWLGGHQQPQQDHRSRSRPGPPRGGPDGDRG